MTMPAAEAAEALAPSSAGLSGTQRAGAISSALPKPRTRHPYIVGLTLIIVGGFSLIGSITGTLPSMLAALFVPAALVDSGGNSPSPDIFGIVGQSLENIATSPVGIITGGAA